MVRAQSHAVLPAAILLATISLSVTPALAQTEGRWAVSLGVGYADQFTYHGPSRGTVDVMGGPGQRFDFSPLATAGVSYRLTDRVTVRADAGYLGYRKGLPLNLAFSSAISIPRQSGSLSAQLPFLSAGIRVYPVRSSTSRPRLYAEALPALWIARWRERFEIGETYDLGGNYYPARTGDDAFTMLDPGFTAGVGFLGPLAGRTKLDLGVRYLFSIGAGRRELGQYSSGDFEGLRQLAFAMSVQAPL